MQMDDFTKLKSVQQHAMKIFVSLTLFLLLLGTLPESQAEKYPAISLDRQTPSVKILTFQISLAHFPIRHQS